MLTMEGLQMQHVQIEEPEETDYIQLFRNGNIVRCSLADLAAMLSGKPPKPKPPGATGSTGATGTTGATGATGTTSHSHQRQS